MQTGILVFKTGISILLCLFSSLGLVCFSSLSSHGKLSFVTQLHVNCFFLREILAWALNLESCLITVIQISYFSAKNLPLQEIFFFIYACMYLLIIWLFPLPCKMVESMGFWLSVSWNLEKFDKYLLQEWMKLTFNYVTQVHSPRQISYKINN